MQSLAFTAVGGVAGSAEEWVTTQETDDCRRSMAWGGRTGRSGELNQATIRFPKIFCLVITDSGGEIGKQRLLRAKVSSTSMLPLPFLQKILNPCGADLRRVGSTCLSPAASSRRRLTVRVRGRCIRTTICCREMMRERSTLPETVSLNPIRAAIPFGNA